MKKTNRRSRVLTFERLEGRVLLSLQPNQPVADLPLDDFARTGYSAEATQNVIIEARPEGAAGVDSSRVIEPIDLSNAVLDAQKHNLSGYTIVFGETYLSGTKLPNPGFTSLIFTSSQKCKVIIPNQKKETIGTYSCDNNTLSVSFYADVGGNGTIVTSSKHVLWKFTIRLPVVGLTTSSSASGTRFYTRNGSSKTFTDALSTTYSMRYTTPRQLAQPSITSSSRTTNSLTISWNGVANATGYKIVYRQTNSSQKYFITKGAGVTSGVITGLKPGVSYYVKAIALGDGNNTKNSPETKYSVLSTKALTALAKPTITNVSTTQTTATVTWNAVPNANGYTLYYRLAGAAAAQSRYLGSSTTTYTIVGLTKGATYYARLVSNGDGVTTKDSTSSAVQKLTTAKVPKLAAPSIKTSATSAHTIQISWQKIANASYYDVIYRRAGASKATTARVSSASSSYIITGLAANTTYSVRVRAVGNSTYSDSDKGPCLQLTTSREYSLTAPTKFQGTASATSFTATWNSVPNAASYTILYYEAGSATKKSQTVSYASTTCKITGLKENTTYYFQIRANGNGDSTITSSYSSLYSKKTGTLAQLKTPTITSAVSDNVSIALNWSASANAVSYVLTYGPSNSGAVTTKTIASSATSYTITGLREKTSYTVKLYAVGDGETTKNSATATKTTSTLTKLATPTITGASTTTTTVAVSWNAVANATGYVVYYYAKDAPVPNSKTLSGSQTKYTISNLKPGTTYCVRVMAISSNAAFVDSAYSSIKETTTKSLVQLNSPTASYTTRANSSVQTSVTLNWSLDSRASGYKLSWSGFSLVTGKVVSGSQTLSSSTKTYTITYIPNRMSLGVTLVALGDQTTYADSAATNLTITL